jgi:hypothetical protein
MMVFVGRTESLPEPLGMPLRLRRGAVEERGAASGLKFKIIEENTDKNTDKMARESRGSKNDVVEVVEKLGCGGGI